MSFVHSYINIENRRWRIASKGRSPLRIVVERCIAAALTPPEFFISGAKLVPWSKRIQISFNSFGYRIRFAELDTPVTEEECSKILSSLQLALRRASKYDTCIDGQIRIHAEGNEYVVEVHRKLWRRCLEIARMRAKC